MLVEVTRSFAYAHDGIRVRRYLPGVQELDEEIAATAIREGWARQRKDIQPKMEPGSPENKMAGVESHKARSTLSLKPRR